MHAERFHPPDCIQLIVAVSRNQVPARFDLSYSESQNLMKPFCKRFLQTENGLQKATARELPKGTHMPKQIALLGYSKKSLPEQLSI